ncbi:MAG: hypothetical protein LBS21_06455 [Clostridiales bacterium]|jgi:N-acetylglutamate synthase-like GNAT family acetyltransferase|nr:hypothetical protein [Clostridiales bacterium]
MNFDGKGKYSRSFWTQQWKKNPRLLLAAKDNDKIRGIAFGWVDVGNCVTVAYDGVSKDSENIGLHEALMVEIEKRAEKLGMRNVVLGILDGREEFYAKMGYTGKTLIQSEKHSVAALEKFNEQYGQYEITGTNIYEGHVNQLWLNSPLLDKNLKRYYEEDIGDCSVQVIVNKEIYF